jgi:hypothetical protein
MTSNRPVPAPDPEMGVAEEGWELVILDNQMAGADVPQA